MRHPEAFTINAKTVRRADPKTSPEYETGLLKHGRRDAGMIRWPSGTTTTTTTTPTHSGGRRRCAQPEDQAQGVSCRAYPRGMFCDV